MSAPSVCKDLLAPAGVDIPITRTLSGLFEARGVFLELRFANSTLVINAAARIVVPLERAREVRDYALEQLNTVQSPGVNVAFSAFVSHASRAIREADEFEEVWTAMTAPTAPRQRGRTWGRAS